MSPPRLAGALIAAALLAPMLPAPGARAAAPPPASGEAGVVRALADCRRLADDARRLACYDAAAGAFEQARAKGEVVVVDRAQVRAVRRQAFGFHLPTLELFPHAAGEAPLQHVALTLASAGRTADGKWLMTTDEGADWVQTDSEEVLNPPHKGSQLAVKSGALGSYFCKVDGQSAFRCQRRR